MRVHKETFAEDGRFGIPIIEGRLKINSASLREFVEEASRARPDTQKILEARKSGSFMTTQYHPENGIARLGVLVGELYRGMIDRIEVVPEYDGDRSMPMRPSTEVENFVRLSKRLERPIYVGLVESFPDREMRIVYEDLEFALEVSKAVGRPIIYANVNSMPSFDKFDAKNNFRAYLIERYEGVNKISIFEDVALV